MLDCQDYVVSFVLSDLAECICKYPCHETSYPVTMSLSEWPSKNSINSFPDYIFKDKKNKSNLKAYSYYQNMLNNNASQESIKTWIRSHFLRVNVFTNSKIVSVKEDIPMYSMIDTLCSIGGCLGLWLGISLVTSAEIVQLIVRLLYELYKYVKVKNLKVEASG